ncbi:MAG: 3-hydroxyisobutyrate dehydrogenase [Thermodesulfobacterium commune]|uniref:NAD(P)-dependent oxidoreductase n=1 Tax=Thermodesulfobacterium commune TaxID=1741 RepID=A0A117LC02_9BACT|nr:MAG: 3-hydroxyisobutyrate dehydrogenase [Thermodesulfobacterium commune]HAA84264.1 NAD(P)-dependent oxidoreductase [Thermodesulfobacterium commune]
MKIGFIGLGTLGREIAKRLISQGVELIIWNRSKEKAKQLELELVETPKDLISMVDKVFIIVSDSEASKKVIFGKDGLVEGDIQGKTIIDLTTNHYRYVVEAEKELKQKGAYYLEAPLLGSVIPAQRGELTVLVGGDQNKFEEAKDIFEKFCRNMIYLGEIGKATKLKLINNIVLGGYMAVLAEAMAIGEKAGLEKELLLEVLSNGAGRSYVLEVKKQKLLEEKFEPHFSVELMYKDLHYAQDLFKDFKAFSMVLQNVKEVYGFARSKDLGHLDFSVVYKIFKTE